MALRPSCQFVRCIFCCFRSTIRWESLGFSFSVSGKSARTGCSWTAIIYVIIFLNLFQWWPLLNFLAFVQACFCFRRLTLESNQGGKFLGIHLIFLYHCSTRANIPRRDQHLCYYYIGLSGTFQHSTKVLTYSNLRFYMHYTYTIFITHTSNRDKIKYCPNYKKADMFTFNNSNIANIRFTCCTSQTKKSCLNIYWSLSCFAVFGGHVGFSPVYIIFFYK